MYNAHVHLIPGQQVWYMRDFETWHQVPVTFVRMNTNAGEWGYCDVDLPDGEHIAVHEGHLSVTKVCKPGSQN